MGRGGRAKFLLQQKRCLLNFSCCLSSIETIVLVGSPSCPHVGSGSNRIMFPPLPPPPPNMIYLHGKEQYWGESEREGGKLFNNIGYDHLRFCKKNFHIRLLKMRYVCSTQETACLDEEFEKIYTLLPFYCN